MAVVMTHSISHMLKIQEAEYAARQPPVVGQISPRQCAKKFFLVCLGKSKIISTDTPNGLIPLHSTYGMKLRSRRISDRDLMHLSPKEQKGYVKNGDL